MIRRARFWDAATCAGIRKAMDRGVPSAAEVLADGYVLDAEARRAVDIDVDAQTCRFAEREMVRLQGWLSRHFTLPLAGFEGPAFLRYGLGGRYGPHCDSGPFPADRRAVSVSLFLNSATGQDGFDGGVLRLYPESDCPPVSVIAEAGLLVAFPSDTVHEVLPVTAGVRDALVTWFLVADPADRELLA